MSKKVKISKDKLSELYLDKGFTTFKIAKNLGCCQATVWKRLKEFGIQTRDPGTKRVKISKKILEELYIHKGFSSWKIGEELGIPRSTIYRKLKKLNVIRDRATAHIIYEKKDFKGDLREKAYLIGFRIGDLGVRKVHPNSKTICVASGSTILEQIELIEGLFEDYGKVWKKKTKDGRINVQVNLNESFDFLLSKEVPNWIFEERDFFLSFLGGFIDAEGHIGISNNMAKFSLGNYDSKLLLLIYKKLINLGINCNEPFEDKRKGKTNSQGYKYRKNYWHFRIHTKSELTKLFELIEPYIKHKNKIKDLNKARNNILYRNKKWQKRTISK